MIRVRFAPSPTGLLHLGNIRTALFNYLFAKNSGGKFILRIEDTDVERSKKEYRDAQMEDLLWMGLRWDEGPEVGGDYGPYEQSQRLPLYQEAVQKLLQDGKAYYCYVTPEELTQIKSAARLEHRPPRYDNRGRSFTAEEIKKRQEQGIKPTVRFKIEKPELVMQDLVRGEVQFNLDDMMGDFVIQRADGSPTFHLGVCVDDALMKITHVIRGEDHLSNTPKHILLYQALGYTVPAFGHLSLVHGQGGEVLSKRMESISVRGFRDKGYLPKALANYIALLGWSAGDDKEIFSWEELIKAFSLERVGKSASAFDPKKLDWVNGEHLRALSDESFTRMALAYLKKTGPMPGGSDEIVANVLPVFKDAIVRLDELPAKMSFLDKLTSYEDAQEWIRSEVAREVLQEACHVIDENQSEVLDFDLFIASLKTRVAAKGKGLFMPLRIAVTGSKDGPEIKRLFPSLGAKFLKNRLQEALVSS